MGSEACGRKVPLGSAEASENGPPVVTKKTRDGVAYFTLQWSGLQKSDKYTIINSVPAEAGIFELYYKDERKKLVLMRVARVWYGGLRSRLRRVTDPELEQDERHVAILMKHEIFYRYSVIRSFDDMKDILYFFASRYTPGNDTIEHSGRYLEIFLEEKSPDKIVTVG